MNTGDKVKVLKGFFVKQFDPIRVYLEGVGWEFINVKRIKKGWVGNISEVCENGNVYVEFTETDWSAEITPQLGSWCFHPRDLEPIESE